MSHLLLGYVGGGVWARGRYLLPHLSLGPECKPVGLVGIGIICPACLQAMVAELFGHEAGIFCPSGTMTNQIAIKLHTQPGDELICSDTAHVYVYEGGGIAFNSGEGQGRLQHSAADDCRVIVPVRRQGVCQRPCP